MATDGKKAARAKRLERQYSELMHMVSMPLPVPPCRENLEQPSILENVETRTTYGAYEEPI